MSLYLGENLISGVNTPVQGRVLGQIIQSTIPLTDAGLHLLDGSTIAGTGAYSAFYNYMMNGYDNGLRINNNVVNNNGVFSGFTNYYNYLYIPGVKSTNNSEYVFKFTTGSDVITTQAIVHCEYLFCIELNSGSIRTWGWGTGSAYGTKVILASISTNTTYWIKVNIDGFSKTFSYSTDGINYTQSAPATWSDDGIDTSANYQFRLGLSSYDSTNPFLGSIDVKGCYIKQNNEMLWDGSQYSVLPGRYIDETRYQEYMTDYGVCGKYAISYKDKTIRLPYITGIIEGTLNSSHIGNVTEAGLPNITGNVWDIAGKSNSTNGAFIYEAATQKADLSSGSSVGNGMLNFNASKSNSIYGNSDTVQPQTVKVYYYIVIATLTKTDIEVDIDEIATDLNGKADKDLINVSSSDIRNVLDNAGVNYVIGVYNNGNSWHRIYSDGWVEQGGLYEGGNGTGYKDINLNVAMADTKFGIIAVRNAETSTTNYNVWGQVPATTASTTMIRVYVSNASAVVRWRVYGYKA